MKRHLASLLMVAGLVGTTASHEDPLKKEIKRLQGKWQLVSLVHDGEVVELAEPKNVITFKGATVSESSNKDVSEFKLNPEKKPKEMDWIGIEGRHKGETMMGIYSLEGDTLKICHSHYSKKGRPTEFASKPGSGHRLLVLKRVNSDGK